MKTYLGIDVGSISTNIALIDENFKVIDSLYIRTQGNPISAVQRGMKIICDRLPSDIIIAGAGTTGSARHLSAAMIGADVSKTEITAHAVAAIHLIPDVKTIFEIGGQDSKVILVRDLLVVCRGYGGMRLCEGLRVDGMKKCDHGPICKDPVVCVICVLVGGGLRM